MYIFIVNPMAGNGKAKRIYQQLQKHGLFKKLSSLSYQTQYKGHAEDLIDHLLSIHEKKFIQSIIVIGGDGTMHEVLNGLKHRQIPVAFIPGGSGNDFARGLHLPKSPDKIMKMIIKNVQPVDYWLGVYEMEQRKRKLFINCIGFGFDAVVTKRAERMRFRVFLNRLHLGTLIYLFALLRELIFFRPIPITMNIDGELIQFERCFLLTVNNHPYFGGGMKINPAAKVNKNTFSVLVVHSISIWKVLILFSTVFSGRHIHFKEVHIYEGENITIHSEVPIPYQIDGETGTTSYAYITKNQRSAKIIASRES